MDGVIEEDSETRTIINLIRICSGIQFTDDKEIYNVQSIEDEFGDLYYEHSVYGSDLIGLIDLNGFKQQIIEILAENYVVFDKMKEKYLMEDEITVNTTILKKVDEIDLLKKKLKNENEEIEKLFLQKREIRKNKIENI